MAILGLPKKELKKTAQELVELHQRVIFHWLVEQDVDYSIRQKFFAIYDHYINYKNINDYFHLPIRVFVISLLRDELDRYSTKPKKKRKKKSRKSRK